MGRSKLAEADVREIHALAKSGVNQCMIARKFDVSGSCVWQILNGNTWKGIYAEVMADAAAS